MKSYFSPGLVALAVVVYSQACAEPITKTARLTIASTATSDISALKPCVDINWDSDVPFEVLGWKEGDECWTMGDLTVLDVTGKEIGADYFRGVPVVTETFKLSRGEKGRFRIYSMGDPDLRVDGDYDAVAKFTGETGGRLVRVTTDKVRFHFSVPNSEKRRANQPPLPTPASDTPAAGAPVAPPSRAAGR